MRSVSIFLLLASFLLIQTPSATADTRVGSLQSSTGTVTIDAFGKSSFIPAVTGDSLYSSTILKTGADGRATILLQGEPHEIAPGATVKIGDLVASGARKSSLGWFGAVGKLIGSFGKAAQRKEGDLVLGSRAADVAQEQADADMGWEVEETDAATLIPEAKKSIDDGLYASALATLAKADPPAEPEMAWELAFWKGDCYFQLEDYGDAAASLTSANALQGSGRQSLGTPETRALLLFQLGSSQFLLGNNRAAIPMLDASIAQSADGPYAPYATLLLSRALATTGDAARSKAVAAAGARKYAAAGLDADFAALSQ